MGWPPLSANECPACSSLSGHDTAALYMALAWETRAKLTLKREMAAFANNVLAKIGPKATLQFACGLRCRGSQCSAANAAWAVKLAEVCEAAAKMQQPSAVEQTTTDLANCQCPTIYLIQKTNCGCFGVGACSAACAKKMPFSNEAPF